MRILVLGGTKFFGLEVVRMLASRGDDVTVLSRRRVPTELTEAVGEVVGDRRDPEVLSKVARLSAEKPFDAVFDNIAMTGEDVDSLLNALQGRLGHYILMSTASVYLTMDHHRPLEEKDADLACPDPDPGDTPEAVYALGKRAAERSLARRAGGQSWRWSVLRPTIVFGPNDPTRRLAYYVHNLLAGKPVGPTGFVFNPVYSQDVARTVVRAMDDPPPCGHVYNLAGRETVSVAELCTRVKGILRIPGPGHDMPGDPDKPPALPPSGRFVLDIERALQEGVFDPTPLGNWLEHTAGMIQQGRG